MVISKELDNLNRFVLLVSIRSMNLGLLDSKHVGLLIRPFKLQAQSPKVVLRKNILQSYRRTPIKV